MPIAEEMERMALGARDAVGGTATAVQGTVRIGSPEGFGSYFLAPRVACLRQRHPELTVQLVAASAVFSLARRDADIAIAVSKPPAGRLTVSKLTDYDLALYAAPWVMQQEPWRTLEALARLLLVIGAGFVLSILMARLLIKETGQ